MALSPADAAIAFINERIGIGYQRGGCVTIEHYYPADIQAEIRTRLEAVGWYVSFSGNWLTVQDHSMEQPKERDW